MLYFILTCCSYLYYNNFYIIIISHLKPCHVWTWLLDTSFHWFMISFRFISNFFSFSKTFTFLWRSFLAILHFCSIAKIPLLCLEQVFLLYGDATNITVNCVLGHLHKASSFQKCFVGFLKSLWGKSAGFQSSCLYLLACLTGDSSPRPDTHPSLLSPSQHGRVRGSVHETGCGGGRQLQMPGFPTAHQKQVRRRLGL